MSYTEMKNLILRHYHKEINYWWEVVGEMFEGTDGFTKAYKTERTLDNKLCYIIWNDYSWEIR